MTTSRSDSSPTWPLSVGQEALWFAHRLQPDSPAYNVGIAVRVLGPLDLGALSHAVIATARRHDLLRSVFIEVAGQPRRMISDTGQARVEVLDLTDRKQVAAAALEELARRELARPFRVDVEPPFRVTLLRLAPTEAVLLIGAHHIVTDADSQLFVLRDMLDAYMTYQRGQQPGWRPLPCTYAEHVEAECEMLRSPRIAELETFWVQACADAPLTLPLPADYSRPLTQRFSGSRYEFRLNDELERAVRAAARAMDVTTFSYLLGVFQALLHRYTSQSDFIIGYVATTRQRRTREVVGYFINSLPVRAHIEPGSALSEIIATAGRNVRNGIAHRDLPLPRIAQVLRAPRDPGRLSMFQVLFSMLVAYPPDPLFDLTSLGGELSYGDLRLGRFDVPQQEGQFDLTVEMVDARTALRGIIKYSTDLFAPRTIENLARHYLRMLAAAATDPGQPAAAVTLVDDLEQARLLAFSSGSQTPLL